MPLPVRSARFSFPVTNEDKNEKRLGGLGESTHVNTGLSRRLYGVVDSDLYSNPNRRNVSVSQPKSVSVQSDHPSVASLSAKRAAGKRRERAGGLSNSSNCTVPYLNMSSFQLFG